jgi:protein SCO1/2
LVVLAFAWSPVQAQEKASGNWGSDEAAVKKGKNLFQARGCFGCHTVGKGKLAGPDLAGVTDKRDSEWLKKWLKAPDEMMGSDPTAQELLKEYKNVKMPNLKLKDDEVESLMHYLAAESAKQKKEK